MRRERTDIERERMQAHREMAVTRRLFNNILPKRFTKGTSGNSYENLIGDNQFSKPMKPGELHRNLQERHMIMIALGERLVLGSFSPSDRHQHRQGQEVLSCRTSRFSPCSGF
jgi:amino acid permease